MNDPIEERDIEALLVMLGDPRVRGKINEIIAERELVSCTGGVFGSFKELGLFQRELAELRRRSLGMDKLKKEAGNG